MIVGVWFVLNWPAVAGKVATLAPAGTVTEAGTVRYAELDARLTVAPVEALTVTLQVLEAPGAKVDGEHTMEVAVTVGVAMFTVPPEAVSGSVLPVEEAPDTLIKPIDALLVPVNVAVRVAAIPSVIALAFMPDATHV